jgi:hypothetical protein
MNTLRSIRIAASGICAAASLCVAAEISAQTVFRHVNLAGGAVYTDQAEAPPASAAATEPEAEAGKPALKRPRISAQLAATVNASEAERRLAQAQWKRRQGIAPLPGEQPLNIRYWQRQEKLRLQVEQAQRRLAETRPPQLAASR